MISFNWKWDFYLNIFDSLFHQTNSSEGITLLFSVIGSHFQEVLELLLPTGGEGTLLGTQGIHWGDCASRLNCKY